MGNKVIYALMKNLIEKRFYETKEEAEEKLGVYFAFSQIDESQLAELMILCETVYAPSAQPEEATE